MERAGDGVHGAVLRLIPLALPLLLLLPLAGCDMTVLTDDNWRVITNGEEWLVEFYAPWCGACKAFAPTWDNFAAEHAPKLGIRAGKADITENGGLAGRFMISHLPTLYHVKDGQFRKYSGSRRIEDLSAFITEEKWKNIEEVVWYMKPDSFNMQAAAVLTEVGTRAQGVAKHLMEEYGVPQWGIALIVVVGILVTGVLIGITCNLCMEKLFFRKRRAPSSEGEEEKKDK